MKHLQTSHIRSLRLHKELKAKAVEDIEVPFDQSISDQGTIAVAGMKKTRTHFMKQDEILTCIVKYLCARGGLPLNIVEQAWFRQFMKLVEPRFQPVSRVAVSTKLDSLYDQERKQLMDEITRETCISTRLITYNYRTKQTIRFFFILVLACM